MRENRQRVSCDEIRSWDMVTFLSILGYEPDKIRGADYWYISPLRNERTASFKVNRVRNRWKDFGDGRGGNLVDFATLYYRCSVSELLQQISNGHCVPRPTVFTPVILPDTAANKIVIENTCPLAHPALLQYMLSRCIPISIVKGYCQEVTYHNKGKQYFAIGFKNDSGGYELRSRYFKGASSPKDFTLIQRGNSNIIVFEGFFDFLSCMILFPDACNASDFLILNSLSFFSRAGKVIRQYLNKDFCLDNNPAGIARTREALSLYPHSIDRSYLYRGFEDLNDYLCSRHNAPDMLPINQKPIRPP